MTFHRFLPLIAAASVVGMAAADENQLIQFKKIKVTDAFWSEGANFGDFNHDGQNDIVSGPFWYEGPNFQKKHTYYPAAQTFKNEAGAATPGFDPHEYSKNFLAFVYDINGDSWPDIIIMGFPGEETFWYENPKGKSEDWTRHTALKITDNESPTFVDINGDGKPEIVCNSEGYFGYAEADWKNPTAEWTFHRISPKGGWQRFTHGIGVGDANNDGQMDILEKDGWWENPGAGADQPWKQHKFAFSSGGSQMYAYDIDGDGDNDIITSLEAHGYGLVWYESSKENGEITFKQHLIMGKEDSQNKYGIHFSQMHAVDLIDIDGDGIKDIVTGKRYWAHGPHGDAEPAAPAVLYWFKTSRSKDHMVDFIPHKIDGDSGIGTQVFAGLINKDKFPDIVVGNKKGTFVFLQERKKVSHAEWEAAEPKPVAK